MILIAIGANLPGPDGSPPLTTCISAAKAIAALPGLSFVALSSWHETAPVPASDQPRYINGVIALRGTPDPEMLLGWLQELERRAGRRRGVLNAARVLDLDIIDLNGVVRVGPVPVLPHPRAHMRGFVLEPIAEVLPDWVHPVLGTTARELARQVRQGQGSALDPPKAGGLWKPVL